MCSSVGGGSGGVAAAATAGAVYAFASWSPPETFPGAVKHHQDREPVTKGEYEEDEVFRCTLTSKFCV